MGTKTPEHPFATLDDLKALYPAFEDSERERAQSLLSLVSQATIRVLQAGEETPIGVTSQSWMATPFQGSTSYANPTGDIYFTTFEKNLLGVDEGDVLYANPLPNEP